MAAKTKKPVTNPSTEELTTAARLAGVLMADADAYHEGRITYEEHTLRNRATWKESGSNPRVDAEVLRILRSRPR